MTRYVVVGGGLAGLRAAEALRARGHAGELVVIGAEDEPPYNRPPLTKDLLAGKVELADIVLPTQVRATWLRGERAVSLQTGERRVVLADGSSVRYDGLVIATGMRAAELPGQAGLRGIHSVRTIGDALAFREAASTARRIVIIGGGVLGTEVAATLAGSGPEIAIVDREEQLVTPLGPRAASLVARWHERAGVRLVLGAGITGFRGAETVEGVALADGRVLRADVVLVAVGGLPDVEWLQGSGVAYDARRGVLTDRWLRVPGHPEIVAAGDVVDFDGGPMGRVRLEHWSHAVESAQVAAASLTGPRETPGEAYRPVPTMWSDQYGHRIQAAGFLRRATRTRTVLDDPASGQWLLEGYDDSGALVAVVGVDARRQVLRRQAALQQSLWADAK